MKIKSLIVLAALTPTFVLAQVIPAPSVNPADPVNSAKTAALSTVK
jgi:hypothetical protein